MSALTPKLTPRDERILRMLPTVNPRDLLAAGELPSTHQIAERLGSDDIWEVRSVLDGLVRVGAAWSSRSRSRGVVVYYRIDEGERT